MARQMTLLLIFSVLLTASCSTIDRGKQVVADAHAAVEKLKAVAAQGQEKFDAYMAKADSDRSRFEQITGPWDQNNDGKVEADEITSLITSTAKGAITDPAKRNLIVDHWQELLASMGTAVAAGWLGLKAKTKAGDAVAAAVTSRQNKA